MLGLGLAPRTRCRCVWPGLLTQPSLPCVCVGRGGQGGRPSLPAGRAPGGSGSCCGLPLPPGKAAGRPGPLSALLSACSRWHRRLSSSLIAHSFQLPQKRPPFCFNLLSKVVSRLRGAVWVAAGWAPSLSPSEVTCGREARLCPGPEPRHQRVAPGAASCQALPSAPSSVEEGSFLPSGCLPGSGAQGTEGASPPSPRIPQPHSLILRRLLGSPVPARRVPGAGTRLGTQGTGVRGLGWAQGSSALAASAPHRGCSTVPASLFSPPPRPRTRRAPGGESGPRWRDSRSRGRLRPGFSHRLCRAEGGDREEAGFVFRGFLLPCSSEPDAGAPFSALPFEGLPQRGVLPSGRSRSQRLLLSEQAGKRSASLGCGESPRLRGVTSFLTPRPSQGGMFPAIVSPEASSRSPSQGHG